VTNISTYWFGRWEDVNDGVWAGSSGVTSFVSSDTALAFTWQNIIVAAGSSVDKSFIASFGSDVSDLTTTTPEPTADPDESGGANVGAIVGGVIGGLVVIGAIVGVVIFLRMRNSDDAPSP
jgi:hypothetical protein